MPAQPDLDLRFTPSPTAQEGIAGHQWVGRRRPDTYQREVVQAEGRIIRSPDDHGVLHLMDERYSRAAVQRLLPAQWRLGG